ncbi:MAG TPA: chloride channel protein [Ktedonobacterales bacterium]|nr:chloride channel protein [Ktedonobacterales bacterium]
MFRLSSLVGESEPALAVAPRSREEARQLIVFSAFGVALGIIGAVVAWLLYHLINIFTGFAWYGHFTTQSPLYPPSQGLGLLTVAIPVVGGLIVGVMAKYGSDRIRGHGIPEAMEAVLKNKSKVGVRVAIFKPISAAIAVGTGGPFGAEGPIIQTGGALGSLIGQTMKLSAKERRILLACGGTAGMVGIFNTPIAAVALALELLLFEFRARSLVPVILAAATAAGCREVLLGSKVMFNLGFLPSIGGPLDLLWFVPLGIIIGLCSVAISKAFYIVEEFFDRLKIDMLWKPALGALILGIVAFFQPRVLGMGYTYITEVLQNHYSSTTLIGLGVGKTLALIASLGSGTSGGLLAPMLLIGATIGSGFGRAVNTFAPAAGINPSICGVVAMSALFSAAARAPLTSFIFAFELTGDYKAILPLMIGCMVADVVARSLSTESIMTERLVRRGMRIDQGYEARLLNLVAVRDVMTRTLETLGERTPLHVVLKGLLGEPVAHMLFRVYNRGADGTPLVVSNNGAVPSDDMPESAAVSRIVNVVDASEEHTLYSTTEDGEFCSLGLRRHWTFPVVDADGRLAGIISRGKLLEAAGDPKQLDRAVGDLAERHVIVGYTDESLDEALMRMLADDYEMLPIVDRTDPVQIVGVLSRADILNAWQLRDRDENQRERLLPVSRLLNRRRTVTTSEAGGSVIISAPSSRTARSATSALFEKNVDTLLPADETEDDDPSVSDGSHVRKRSERK